MSLDIDSIWWNTVIWWVEHHSKCGNVEAVRAFGARVGSKEASWRSDTIKEGRPGSGPAVRVRWGRLRCGLAGGSMALGAGFDVSKPCTVPGVLSLHCVCCWRRCSQPPTPATTLLCRHGLRPSGSLTLPSVSCLGHALLSQQQKSS